MKNKRSSCVSLTVIICTLIITLGWVYLVNGTTIGANITTTNFYASTSNVSNVFIVDSSGNASTTGTFIVSGSASLATTTSTKLVTVDGLKFTGATTTVSGGGAVTLTAGDICDNAILRQSPTIAAASTTLPAATALIDDCLPSVGSFKDLLFRNVAGTAASSTYVVASTGITILYASGTSATGAIKGGEDVLMRFIYTGTGVVEVIYNIFY